MIQIIIGIVLVIFALGIIISVLEFLWEHKGVIITLLIIGGIIYYFASANKPLAFLKDWGNAIVVFLHKITYGNTIFDTIWIYLCIALISWIGVNIISRLVKNDIVRIVISTVVSAVALISVVVTTDDWKAIFISTNVALNLIILFRHRIATYQKIGLVSDVDMSFDSVRRTNMFSSLMYIIPFSGCMDYLNNVFATQISMFYIPMAVGVIVLFVELKSEIKILSGYRWMVKHIKENAFFAIWDFKDQPQLAYLGNPEEYYKSVVFKLSNKEKVYDVPDCKGWFFNRKLEKQFEKYINSNVSSEEVQKGLDVDFRKFKFEKIYMSMFAKVKGYSIEFAESDDAKDRKNSGVGIGATEFVLMRYPIEKHPILQEPLEVREKYLSALRELVECDELDKEKWFAKVEEYKKELSIEGEAIASLDAVEFFKDTVKRKINFFKTIKTDYSYLLLLEGIYFKNLLTKNDITYQEIEKIFKILQIRNSDRDFIYQYIKAMYIDGDDDKAEKLVNSSVKSDVRKVLQYVHFNIMWNETYVRKEQYKVAVCATMSAGKSTFINSLLGIDFIPAKNEACTAKVTTIRDNDNLKKIIGCYTRNDNSKVYSNIIDSDKLLEWNDDNNVVETILEGNIEEVSCDNCVLVINDTPGTNNSEDTSHHDKTIDFLKSSELDLIIYLINAEYISTNDTEILLKEIQEITKESKTKIIFGLNKIDAYDEENGESIDDAVNGLEEQIKAYGFDNPVIFPFSANAARLFKMVLKGIQLTKREKRTFDRLLEQFDTFNASDYQRNAETSSISTQYIKEKNDVEITVDDNSYQKNRIICALEHTGILNVENWLETEMKNKI